MKSFTRLRDFLEDGPEDVPITFEYSASFRIAGLDLPFDEIERVLQLSASHTHRKGEHRGKTTFKEDMWRLESPLVETRPLSEHLDWLWTQLAPHKAYLLTLKKRYHIDVFAGYRSSCDMAGLDIPIASMQIYFDLGIPFGLSIVVA
jgi:hypothetical protein